MFLLSDVIRYVRRLIKSPSDAQITDNLIIDYINRFYISDMDARIQLFDLKNTYQFETIPGIDTYNMPLYAQQGVSSNETNYYPVYQNVDSYASVNGVQIPFYTQKDAFYGIWPQYIQSLTPAATGTGGTTYTINLPFMPAMPGHMDMQGIINIKTADNTLVGDPLFLDSAQLTTAIGTGTTGQFSNTSVISGVFLSATDTDGNNITVADSGLFFNGGTDSTLYGALMSIGASPYGNTALAGGYSTILNTVNYDTGVVNVVFPSAIPTGNVITAQCYFYVPGMPRAVLFYNNSITLRSPPDKQYLVSLNAYLTPAAFLATTDAIPFGYMSEYIARGAARKILSDTGDIEQFQFYEPLFREQEMLVWKRSQRIFTSTPTRTIFNQGIGGAFSNNTTQGGI